ncbi:MAG: hypothetical protein ACXW19_04660 [Thermoanaerobaculia bacterium]
MKHCVTLFILLLLPITAAAKTRRLTLEDVRDKADAIFIGRVTASSVRPVLNGSAETTDYVVAVSEVLYGAVSQTTTVSFFGSAKFRVEESPLLEQGREYLFFRTAKPGNTTVGWRAGLFTVETAMVGKNNRTVFVSGDGAPLLKVGGGLAQGDPVTVRNGEIVARTAPASAAEARNTNAVPEGNVRFSPHRNVQPAAASAQSETFATLDDLRAFVRAKPRAVAEEKP